MAAAQPAVPTMNTPQHAPEQLDFGQVLDGKSATRTLSLTTNAPGYVTVNIPPGPFRVAEFREMAQTQNPSKINNGQFPAAGAVRSTPLDEAGPPWPKMFELISGVYRSSTFGVPTNGPFTMS